MDAAPEQRNILGLIEADPALMRRVIMLRKWGQEVIKTVFGRRMHGISSVPEASTESEPCRMRPSAERVRKGSRR